MEKNDLVKEFEEGFKAMKEELGFSAALKELNTIFFLEDFIQKEGFVSRSLSRQVCARITDTFGAWFNYLHSLIMPNPSSMLNLTESQVFSEDDRNGIMTLMNKIMVLVSDNTLAGITKDKKLEAKFIDDSVELWKKEVKPKMKDIISRVRNNWDDKANGIEEEVKE